MSEDPNKDFISIGEAWLAGKIKTESDFFSNIEVLTNAAGDLDAKIANALAELGLFVIVDIKGGPLPGVNDSKPWTAWITISENPILNRGTGPEATGKTCRMALQELAVLLDEKLGLGNPKAEPVENDDGLEIWRVIGTMNATIKGRAAA